MKGFVINVKVDQKSNKFFNDLNQGEKYQCYKVEQGDNVDAYEFYCCADQITIHAVGAQMERAYKIGRVQELDDFEKVLIESREQVINSWATGKVHF